nr:MAG TPA: hypothetical protein [Caudoviricetes sp.]
MRRRRIENPYYMVTKKPRHSLPQLVVISQLLL